MNVNPEAFNFLVILSIVFILIGMLCVKAAPYHEKLKYRRQFKVLVWVMIGCTVLGTLFIPVN